jgi:DNA replication protein DnaC
MAAETRVFDQRTSMNGKPRQNTTLCPKHQLEVPLKTIGTPPFSHIYAVCPECKAEEEEQTRKAEEARQDIFRKWQEDGRKQRLLENIPPRFENAKLADFKNIDQVLQWVGKPEEFFLIVGPCGTGKTRLACAMAIALRQKEITTKIVYSSDLFLSLRQSFNAKAGTNQLSEFQIIEAMTAPPVLICDDIGVQKQTEYVIEAWYNIIDARYRNCKPTAFTSNLSLKEISAFMSDRVASRLMSGTVVTLAGKDRRVTKG